MDENQSEVVSSVHDGEQSGQRSENSPQVDSPSTSEQEVNKQPSADDSGAVTNENTDSKLSEVSGAAAPSSTKKKTVYFPGDDNIVKSYLEPPDPWKDVPNWTTADLIRAYRKSCEKHGTKPLNKLLHQLQCIENIGERYEILSLKGERLDLRQCESLEDIFRHVRFRCIDLEATHLDDEMAVALFEMIEYYESACKVNISFNKGIGPRGWQSCAKLVRKTPSLTFIDARNCELNERVMVIFGRALRMGCFLQRLQLQNTNLAGKALVLLVGALKLNEILKELFIGDNKLLPTDGIQIGNLLKYNHSLQLLDLRNNNLQDAGIGHICDGLAEQWQESGLITLVLWNNQITFQAINSINKALTTAVHLETLNLGHNPITNEGIHILKDGLLKAKGLLKLGLSGAKVSCEGAVALAEVIADNTKLIRMDLQENDIKTAGLMALSLALRVNENITRLDVDRDTKKESGVRDYVEQQRKLQKDIAELLDRNLTALRKREQEAKEREERRLESERQLREAAEDLSKSLEEQQVYIPGEDSIHRPKLLFIPHICPEQELDSPEHGSAVFNFPATSKSNTLSFPPSTDILSPQYCANPKATAKRIFSVTRVTSPTGPPPQNDPYLSSLSAAAASCVVNSPTAVHPPLGRVGELDQVVDLPHLCMPLPTADIKSFDSPIPLTIDINASNISPNTIQKGMADQTLENYIQQIVGEQTKGDKTDRSDSATQGQGDNTENVDKNTNANETISKPESTIEDTKDNSDVTGKNEVNDENSKDVMDQQFNRSCDTDSEPKLKANDSSEIQDTNQISTDLANLDIKDPEKSDIIENTGETKSETSDSEGTKSGKDSVKGTSEVSRVEADDICAINEPENNASCDDDLGMNVNISSNAMESDNSRGGVKESDIKDSTVEIDEDSSPATKDCSNCDSSDTTDDTNCPDDKTNSVNDEAEIDGDQTNRNTKVGKSDGDEINETSEDMESFVECGESVDDANDESNEDQNTNADNVELSRSPVDSEPWNAINVDSGETVNPDFHTNFSPNGLRQVLASVIDEESPVSNGSIPHSIPTNLQEAGDSCQ